MLKKLLALLIITVFITFLSVFYIQSDIINEKEDTIIISLTNGIPALNITYLKEKNDKNLTENKYKFLFFNNFLEVLTQIANNKTDMAFLPSNVAATLYNKNKGSIKVISISSMENFYIVSKDITAKKFEDFKYKSIYLLKKDIYIKPILETIFKKNNLSPESDLNIEVLTNEEILANEMGSGKIEFIILDELRYLDFVNLERNCNNSTKYTKIFNLNKEWQRLNGNNIPIICIVARKDFIEKKNNLLEKFLKDYNSTFNDVNNDLIRTANLSKDIIKIESEIIKSSIPNCNLVNISGKEMSNLINNFLKEIFPLIKKDIDEKIPNKDFYYNNFMIKKQNVTA